MSDSNIDPRFYHTIANDIEFTDDIAWHNQETNGGYFRFPRKNLIRLGGQLDEINSNFQKDHEIWIFPDNSRLLVTNTYCSELF